MHPKGGDRRGWSARAWRNARERLLRLTSPGGVPRTVNGATYRVDARTRATFTAIYEAGASAMVRARVQRGDEGWNVGANVGVHMLQLCTLVGPAGRVVAFEPNPFAAELLRRNAQLNGFEQRVEVIASAVGDRDATIDLQFRGSDGMARPGKANPLLPDTQAVPVPMITLDTFWKGRDRTPSCVVMDIEGWEVGALSEAHQLLAAVRDSLLLIVELHPDAWAWSGHARSDFERLLTSYDLEAVGLSGQVDPLGMLGQVVLRPR